MLDSTEAIVEVLSRSPLLEETTMGLVRGAMFVSEVRALLVELEIELEPMPSTVEEATFELEELLDVLATVTVESVPKSGADVLYRRASYPEGDEETATTNETFKVRPALYVFQILDADGKVLDEKRKQCTSTCRVVFNLNIGR